MNKNCTIYKTTNFMGKKWTLPILLEIYKGKNSCRRYSEIKKKIPGITPKILSARLKEMEKSKIIKKKVDASEFPIKCEYSLSESGRDFIKVIQCVKKWALKWQFKNKECSEINCKNCLF